MTTISGQDQLENPTPTPSAASIDIGEGETSQVVGRADVFLAALPERYRRILASRFPHGYSVGDAAHAMGVNARNATVLRHRRWARPRRCAAAPALGQAAQTMQVQP